MEGEWLLQRWPVYLTFKSPHLPLHQNMRGEREDFMNAKIEKYGHVIEVVTLMGGRMVMLQRWSL